MLPEAVISEEYTVFISLFLIDIQSVLEPHISQGLASFMFLFAHDGNHTPSLLVSYGSQDS